MPVSGLLSAGLELMLMGMGVVFLLLPLLVFTLTYASRFIQRIQEKSQAAEPATPAPLASQPASVVAPPALAQAGTDQDLVAVISAAIYRYRATRSPSN